MLAYFAILMGLFPMLVWGQIVTASFDRSVLSINPASATGRGINQTAIFTNFRKADSKIIENTTATGQTSFEEKIKINKTGVYFTGHGNFSPELYLSKDTAQKDIKMKSSGVKDGVKTDLINNFVNLGLRMTSRLSLGLKAYAPSYDIDEDYHTTYQNGDETRYSSSYKNKIFGFGPGITYQLDQELYIGGYYTKITDKLKYISSYTDVNGQTNTSRYDDTYERFQYGVGLSWLMGRRGDGLRFETAYSKMELDKKLDLDPGEEFYTALEYSHSLLTFGGSVKFRKNSYFDHVELIHAIIGEQTVSDKFEPAYSFFLSWGHSADRGHSIGIGAVAYNTEGEKKLFGTEQKAKTTISQFTFSYAYLY